MLKLMLPILLVSLSATSFAEEKKTYSGKIIVGDSSEYTYSNSSEANRQALNFGFGYSGAFFRSDRYSLFYYLNPDLLLELSTRQVNNSVDDSSESWDHDERAYGISANFFTKDAWLFRIGLLNRQSTFSNNYYDRDDQAERWRNTYDVRVNQHDLAGEFAIGSQWQWSSFYIGFDWFVYEHRLTLVNSSTSLVVKDSEHIIVSNAENRLEGERRAAKNLNKDAYYSNLRIGWSF